MDSLEQIPRAPRVKMLSSVLVKPSSADCNLDCTYCFYLKKADLFPETKIHRMSEAVLDAMVRQVMRDGGDQVSFGWQGGEPTLMGLDFYRRAVALQQRYGRPGQNVGNGLQTNGVLLNEDWADFLREYNWLVGLSIDGPEHIHDHYRVTKGGFGTFERVARSARLLLERGVEANALTVVNDYSARFPDEIYDFHKSLGFQHMQFIPCVETNPDDPDDAAPFSVSPEAYGEFLCRIFDRWTRDFHNGQPTTFIRHFDSVFYTYVGMPAPECTLLGECGIYVVVEHNGNVYSCDFFVDEDHLLGNVLGDDLIEMLNSPRQKAFGETKRRVPEECLTCRWLKHCYGGCPKDRINNPRTGGDTHFCRSYKIFLDHADARLRRMAERWMDQQRRARRQPQAAVAPAAERPRTGATQTANARARRKRRH